MWKLFVCLKKCKYSLKTPNNNHLNITQKALFKGWESPKKTRTRGKLHNVLCVQRSFCQINPSMPPKPEENAFSRDIICTKPKPTSTGVQLAPPDVLEPSTVINSYVLPGSFRRVLVQWKMDVYFLQPYCWWNKSCTSWYGKYPIIYRVLYIPSGAGFLPSTIVPFSNKLRHFPSWTMSMGEKE